MLIEICLMKISKASVTVLIKTPWFVR